MIKIDRYKVPPPEIFYSDKVRLAQINLEKFYSASDTSRSQHRFSRPFSTEIGNELRIHLKQLFNNKCAYCETQINPGFKGDIDHFRPKSGARGLGASEFSGDHYWWLTYEWRNIYYSCQICNRFKSTWFPVEEGYRADIGAKYESVLAQERNLLIDPCLDQPEHHLLFKPDGRVDYLSQLGRVTIEILKLNREDLINARQHSLNELFGVWEEFLKKWSNSKRNWKRLAEIAGQWVEILNLTSLKPYLAAQKQFLLERFEHYPDIRIYFESNDYLKKSPSDLIQSEVSTFTDYVLIEGLGADEKRAMERSIDLTKLKHVYLEKLVLKNYKCFSDIEIQFDNIAPYEPSEELGDVPVQQPWLLFLGENGVGKSSILKAIAVALMSNDYRNRLKENIAPDDLLRKNAKTGFIKLFLKGEIDPILVEFRKGESKLRCSNENAVTNLLGYGSVRLLPKKSFKPEKIKNDVIKVGNLFNYSIALEDADRWLLKLNDHDFNMAARSLKDLMSLNDEDQIIRNIVRGEVNISDPSGKLTSIEDLSDGYKSVYALGIDIMSSLSSEKIFYNLSEAIVLIDEIGTHLHPRWKMEVVSQLRRAFPQIQFIVTTHEPLCLRGLQLGETVVLTKNDKQVSAITDLPDPSKLRVDQLLTSEFFGLQSTMDVKTEKIFDEYYAILALDDATRNDEQRNRLLELSKIVPKIKHLGDSVREELIYYVVDELLAKKAKNGGLEIKEDLKEQALSRVRSIWNSLNLDKETTI